MLDDANIYVPNHLNYALEHITICLEHYAISSEIDQNLKEIRKLILVCLNNVNSG